MRELRLHGQSNLVLTNSLQVEKNQLQDLDVINVMKNGRNTYGRPVAIFEDCIILCREFVDVIFEHCPREANMAAHKLASRAVGLLPTVWKDEPLIF